MYSRGICEPILVSVNLRKGGRGIRMVYLYGTCLEQMFGHAGTNLGRTAGRVSSESCASLRVAAGRQARDANMPARLTREAQDLVRWRL